MTDRMQKQIGRRVFVESGFRNSAHQLFLFLASMKRHNYSVRETVRFVALPGYSEHGCPARQAVDLLTQEGFNVDTPPVPLLKPFLIGSEEVEVAAGEGFVGGGGH
jgi:hypothetical protein